MARKRLPKTRYRSPKGRAETGAPLPLNKLLLGAKHRLPMERNALWHTTLRKKYSTDEFVDKLYAQGVKPSAALRAYDSCKETNLWMQVAQTLAS